MESTKLMSVTYLVAARERRAVARTALGAAIAWRVNAPLFGDTPGGAASNHSSRPTGDSVPSGNLVV